MRENIPRRAKKFLARHLHCIIAMKYYEMRKSGRPVDWMWEH
jgi:hypothetical protein